MSYIYQYLRKLVIKYVIDMYIRTSIGQLPICSPQLIPSPICSYLHLQLSVCICMYVPGLMC